MQTARVITDVCWIPGQGFDPRSGLVLSDSAKIRLDPEDHQVKLKLVDTLAGPRYSTDADISARSRTYEPQAMRSLNMVQVFATTPDDTSIGLRIFDGTDEMWWDGAMWSAAGAGEWNTEAEINANLATLDVTARKFAVVVNLATTNSKVTPAVELVKVMWEGPVDWIDDALLDSLVATFQDELQFIVDAALPPLGSATSTIDLDDYMKEGAGANLNIAGVDAVFDDTLDPDHLVDLLSSYDGGTREITLSSSIPIASQPYLRLLVAPEVAWDTHQDFEEVSKLPQIILRDTNAVRSSSYPLWGTSGIVRKDTGAAVEVPPPRRMTFEVTAELRTDRTRQQHRLQEAFMRLLEEGPASEAGPFLRSRATDRRYRIWLIEEFTAVNPVENSSDLRINRVTFRVEDVAVQLSRARDTYGVLTTNLGYNRIDSLEEQEALAAEAPVPTTETEEFEVPEP